MVEDIYEWAISITAGHELAHVEDVISEKERSNLDLKKNFKDLRRLFDNVSSVIKDAPGVKAEFVAYKEAESHPYYMMASGYPTSLKLKDFSGIRKEGELDPWWKETRSGLESRIDYTLDASDKSLAELGTRIKDLKRNVEPGFKASPTHLRKFPMDLRDWRYEQEFSAKMEKVRGNKVEEYREMISGNPGMEGMLSDLVEAASNEWKSIKVALEVERNGVYAGNWHPFSRTLTLVLPWGTSGGRKLLQVVRHEMQHMAQTFMAEALEKDPYKNQVGMPSSKVRTPDYNQNMDSNKSPSPELTAQKRKIMRRLQSQGIDVRGMSFHSMDDIEFMTKLADSIDDFDHLKDTGAVKDLKAAVRVFTGQGSRRDADAAGTFVRAQEFFTTLKRLAPGKYKIALKEFVKAVL